MNNFFQDKRVLVTGASQGLGLGIATELLRKCAKVTAISNQLEKLEEIKEKHPSVRTAYVDLSDWHSTRAILYSLGPFDGLVNNAGVCYTSSFLECTPEEFDSQITINAKSVLNTSQVVTSQMIENGIKGSIVNISSQASKAALLDHVAYCASKAAIDSMTRVIALEVGQHGIRVNTVNPTVTMTELGRRVWAPPEKSSNMLSRIPLGRFAEVPEVVNAVLFLLSDDASMISGVNLPVDGGFLAT